MGCKVYNKIISCFTSGFIGFSLCGCSNEEKFDNSDSISTSSIVSTTGLSSTTTFLTTRISTTVSTTMSTTTVCDIYTDFDVFVIDYFQSFGDIIRENIDSDDLKEKGKSYFIFCVDFLFYDSKINGIGFDDLTDSAKEQLLSDISIIDELICSKFPNYKEEISDDMGDFYNFASDLIKRGKDDIKEFSREKLGDENYEKIGIYYDMFKDQTISDLNDINSLFDSGRSKVKDWYENYRRGQ